MSYYIAILYSDSISNGNGGDLLFSETEAACSGSYNGISYDPVTGRVCGNGGRGPQMYVKAKTDPAKNDDGVEFVPRPNEFDEVDDLSWSVALSAKDLVILALAVVNVVTMITMCFVCAKSKRTGAFRVKNYHPVAMGMESEMDQLQV